jgi:hypothetical protein
MAMTNDTGRDEKRTAVKTYVPKYQKENWKEHAEELDMTQSEFVRTMVQAGRRDFEVPPLAAVEAERSEPAPSEAETFRQFLRGRILAVLDVDSYTHEDLRDALVDELEEELDGVLDSLQAENRIMYGRDGYRRVDDTEATDA